MISTMCHSVRLALLIPKQLLFSILDPAKLFLKNYKKKNIFQKGGVASNSKSLEVFLFSALFASKTGFERVENQQITFERVLFMNGLQFKGLKLSQMLLRNSQFLLILREVLKKKKFFHQFRNKITQEKHCYSISCFLADPGKARGYSINSLVIDSFID